MEVFYVFCIKQARLAKGITQEELAVRVNVTKEFISYIENGHKDPSISLLRKIAKELNTNVKALIADEDSIKEAM